MRRTKYSNEFKVQVVKEALETVETKQPWQDVTSLPPILSQEKWGVISVEGISL
ncbi:hypothetical protein [Paenibacillus larvae]|uniref:hypothetical protein n=1 Tax=Paenibacillus larvae TaxID=1464 RepID=UPI00288ECF4B|nr:hypothetical protein [Paenibacillus larvae]MDT2193313.1 hypothetical protein [Paenibacillus larvae]